MGAVASITSTATDVLTPAASTIAQSEGGESVDPSQIVDTGAVLSGCRANPSFVCERVLEWTGSETAADVVAFIIDRPLKIVLILVVAWFVNRLTRRWITGLVVRVQTTSGRLADISGSGTGAGNARAEQRADALSSVFRSVATIVIWTIAIMLVLSQLGINLAPLLAGAGIVGLALGFGAQSLVKDFLSGIFMLVEDQYGVGDIVDAGRASGTVEKVTLRETVIREVNGTVWHVPNGQITEVGNKSQYWARALLDIGVAYDTDLREAQTIIKAVADEMRAETDWSEKIHDEPEVWGIENLAADSVNIRLVVQTAPASQWAVERELRLRIKEALDTARIEIPFAQRTIWLRTEPGADIDISAPEHAPRREPNVPGD